jgi:uncharacterized protein YpuA (DUF1002 family)
VLRKITQLKVQVKKAFEELRQTKQDKFNKIVGDVMQEYGLDAVQDDTLDKTAYLNCFNVEFEQEERKESERQAAFERWNLIR